MGRQVDDRQKFFHVGKLYLLLWSGNRTVKFPEYQNVRGPHAGALRAAC